MIPITSNGGHSAKVKIQLLMNGSTISVAQLGPDFLLLDEPFDHPPGDAGLRLQVDQSEHEWQICLPHGISASSSRVRIRNQAK
jgi:hypothetical protein